MKLVRYLFRWIQQCMRATAVLQLHGACSLLEEEVNFLRTHFNRRCLLNLPTRSHSAKVVWLGLHAFCTCLERRPGQYGPLLQLLRRQRDARALARLAPQLVSVTAPARSAQLFCMQI